jgi:O-antigen ligase
MSRPLAVLVAAVLGAAFFAIEHNLHKSVSVLNAAEVEEIQQGVAGGSTQRQAAYLCVGALGLVLTCRRGGRPVALSDPLLLALLILSIWSALSIAWSDDCYLTFKRVVELGCCLAAALGLARQASLRDLHYMTVALLLVYTVLGLLAEGALGTFQPWVQDYRFAGTMHPNAQGLNIAALILGLVLLLGAGRDNRLWIVLAAAAAVLLLLTRSRSAVFGLAAAFAALGWLKMSPRGRTLAATAAGGLVAATLLVWAVCGVSLVSPASDALLLGRTEDAETLSGRLPLWTELLGYARQRPWAGYGYDSFWTPPRIEDVSAACEWTIHVAHSAYLETLLSLGLVGTVLLAFIVMLSLRRLATSWLSSGEPAYGFFFALLVLGLVKGIFESGLAELMFIPVATKCGLFQAATARRSAAAAVPQREPAEPVTGDTDQEEDGLLPILAGFRAVPAK